MSTVNTSLATAIEGWIGLRPYQYVGSDSLSDLWARTGHPSPYSPVGITSLIICIKRMDAFSDCVKAKEMTLSMFLVGAALQTQGDLLDYLENCPDCARSPHP